MSVRAVWIVKWATGGVRENNILLTRTYPTVEKRARTFSSVDKYVAVPEDREFCQAINAEFGCNAQSTQFIKSRDSCQKVLSQQKPVYELTTEKGKLWPVIIVEQYGLMFCCLPLVEAGCDERPPLISIPGISVGFSLLLQIADLLGPLPNDADQNSPKFQDLYDYLCFALPFGTPLDIDAATVKAALLSKPIQHIQAQKQPAWKPVLMKGGKSQVQFVTSECVRAVLYGNQTVNDVWDVYGTVTCKAELEGLPDVTVNLSVAVNHPPLDNLIVHPCVNTADTQSNTGSVTVPGSSPGPRRLRFSPPLETFTLCHYSSSYTSKLPIQGFYQMRGDKTSVKLLVQLKLQENVKNNFDYCELQIPFYNRGSIVNIEHTATVGTVYVGPKQYRLVWSIGQRFPGRHLEIELNAVVNFKDYDAEERKGVREDPFCVGLNAYAKLLFKISDYTLSGCFVDQKSVQIYPSTKAKLTTVRELVASEYKIWNSHGDYLASFPTPKYLLS